MVNVHILSQFVTFFMYILMKNWHKISKTQNFQKNLKLKKSIYSVPNGSKTLYLAYLCKCMILPRLNDNNFHKSLLKCTKNNRKITVRTLKITAL